MRRSAFLEANAAVSRTSLVWEECACLLCGSRAALPLLEASDPLRVHGGLLFLVVKCPSCGLCFTNPRPDSASMSAFYPPTYACHQSKQDERKTHFWKPDPLRNWLPIQGLARLLDVGCGAGDFLQRMFALGWNVTGLDSSATAIERVPQQNNLSAHVGTLPYLLWPDASFEAITMRQALEHMHQPLEALHDAFRLLVPGGRLLVTVPNLAGFASRWFGTNWYGLDLPRHLTHFTPRTLQAMLQRAGFAHIDLHQESRHSWIRHSARLAAFRSEVNFPSRWLHTRFFSGLAGRWGRLCGQGECLRVLAMKPNA